MKAIIAGGGIGGLTAALCFTHFGWETEILEKSPELGEAGAGIQLSPNAMKVFETLGLGAALAQTGFRPEGVEIRMGESGLRLIRMPLGDSAIKRWGAPYLHIHRADLISVLQTALAARTQNTVRLGAPIEAYRQDQNSVTISYAKDSKTSGDVFIGADGIHSTVRAQMLGPDKPVFTGNIAWRSTVPVQRLGKDTPDPVTCAWMGRGKHAVTYLLRGGQLANFVGVIERDDWTKENWTEPGTREECLSDFEGWHPKVTSLIKESDKLFRWALFDRKPLARWVEGRVGLMGDAAHPMLPFMAQGAAMAIEDAWMLAATLSRSAPLSQSLEAYQAKRFTRASQIQAASRANAKTFHQRKLAGQIITYGPMWLAGRLAPLVGLKGQDPAYSYDVISASKEMP